MSTTLRLEVPKGKEDAQDVADALNASLASVATVTPRRLPSGSLASIDPGIQSFIVEILNSKALQTILELVFVYFINHRIERVRVGDVEVDLRPDPKQLARITADRLTGK
jgi:hypothetical protein